MYSRKKKTTTTYGSKNERSFVPQQVLVGTVVARSCWNMEQGAETCRCEKKKEDCRVRWFSNSQYMENPPRRRKHSSMRCHFPTLEFFHHIAIVRFFLPFVHSNKKNEKKELNLV
jgi:hypothetical protein